MFLTFCAVGCGKKVKGTYTLTIPSAASLGGNGLLLIVNGKPISQVLPDHDYEIELQEGYHTLQAYLWVGNSILEKPVRCGNMRFYVQATDYQEVDFRLDDRNCGLNHQGISIFVKDTQDSNTFTDFEAVQLFIGDLATGCLSGRVSNGVEADDVRIPAILFGEMVVDKFAHYSVKLYKDSACLQEHDRQFELNLDYFQHTRRQGIQLRLR